MIEAVAHIKWVILQASCKPYLTLKMASYNKPNFLPICSGSVGLYDCIVPIMPVSLLVILTEKSVASNVFGLEPGDSYTDTFITQIAV